MRPRPSPRNELKYLCKTLVKSVIIIYLTLKQIRAKCLHFPQLVFELSEEMWRRRNELGLNVDHNLNGRDMCVQNLPDHDANRNDFFPSIFYFIQFYFWGQINSFSNNL